MYLDTTGDPSIEADTYRVMRGYYDSDAIEAGSAVISSPIFDALAAERFGR